MDGHSTDQTPALARRAGAVVHTDDGSQEDRARTWGLYVATTLLNFASLLNAVFVFAAHVLVGAAAVMTLRRRGAPVAPLVRRLVAVWETQAVAGRTRDLAPRGLARRETIMSSATSNGERPGSARPAW